MQDIEVLCNSATELPELRHSSTPKSKNNKYASNSQYMVIDHT